MEIVILKNEKEIAIDAADIIEKLVLRKPDCVLGLATGSTPIPLYKELIKRHKEKGLDFSKVTTFNLDEYVNIPKDHEQSYRTFMQENLFQSINVLPGNINIPDGNAKDLELFCEVYEERIRKAGGIDLQVLGIGRDGHIAFNEPGSSLASRTRIKTLTKETIEDNARFFDKPEDVPRFAITMGVGTIMEARVCLMLVNGAKKADTVVQALEGPVTAEVTASMLQLHPRAIILLDKEAGSKLKRRDYYEWVYQNKKSAKTVF